MNVVTAISAIGPTYFFPAIKALKDFAISGGLDESVAMKIITQTISGTALLVEKTRKDPEELKLMIGTRTIDEKAVKETFQKAVEEALSKIKHANKKVME